MSLAEAALLAPVAAQPGLNPQDDPLRARERSADLLFALLGCREDRQGRV